ncbi:MAG: hypothetical protein PHP45_10505 [Elusimicrobiales bacterium]|nr:hypothetical protein [Elusimicrobiales bacterium]
MKLKILIACVVSAACAGCLKTVWAQPAPETSYAEMTVTGEGAQKLPINKPKLAYDFDPLEVMSPLQEADEKLFLADSPITFDWRHNRPALLKNPRVVRPQWLELVSPGKIAFDMTETVSRLVAQPEAGPAAKNAGAPLSSEWYKGLKWELDILGEDGRAFHSFTESGKPPAVLAWNGRNRDGGWLRAGHLYSVFFSMTDAEGARYSGPGMPMQLDFPGLLLDTGETVVTISLDTAMLFGADRMRTKISEPAGARLAAAALDAIKLAYPVSSVAVRCYAPSQSAAEEQAAAMRDLITAQLLLSSSTVTAEGFKAPASERHMAVVIAK